MVSKRCSQCSELPYYKSADEALAAIERKCSVCAAAAAAAAAAASWSTRDLEFTKPPAVPIVNGVQNGDAAPIVYTKIISKLLYSAKGVWAL
ncbi:unnamed protein product [Leptosia nina]|uniref:Uncharacterized protein n=1 Tax=Leptosia nina TaxID=320188 RepID=A0AAV1JVV5_9NEOP